NQLVELLAEPLDGHVRAAAPPRDRFHHRQRPARRAGGRRPAPGVRPWFIPVMSPNHRTGARMRFMLEEREVRAVRGADGSEGFRQEPARGYGVHLRAREIWPHDEENAEAAADAMKRPRAQSDLRAGATGLRSSRAST